MSEKNNQGHRERIKEKFLKMELIVLQNMKS